ncbi:flavin monoamine oxidase family protein [Cellulomonas telluris]|uniref:flavin monoamine oxidase family protein n=1 Tax=Cellulomonas telluris TaxID=2306636 RepID=UPI0010A8DFA9|nr:FAD-dependent oxidoreductase [Cellulomonas telluris]
MTQSVGVDVDVVVVGAGLSGLAAARTLQRHGLTVRVLEALDRVGGRVLSATVAGGHADLGGTFVGPDHERVTALADEVGVHRRPTHEAGDNLLHRRGRVRRYRGTIPPVGTVALLDLARTRSAFARASRGIPLGRPGDAPGAEALDARTLGGWLAALRTTRATRDLMAVVTRTSWGCEPAEISLLHVLHYAAQAGGLDRMLDTAGGAQEQHFVEGAQEVAVRVAAALGAGAVELGAPVLRVDHGDDGVAVRTDAGVSRARRAVVAVPPAMRRRIRFVPALPAAHRRLAQRWSPGLLSKAYAVYDAPFWRDAGLSGMTVSDEGPVVVTFDVSPPDASRGVLLGFVGGDHARTWDVLDAAERRRRVLSSLARLLGGRALDPLGYVDQRWGEEDWIGGGPTAAPGPGAVAWSGAGLAEPVGPLHWAGTETAHRLMGFMDGAVSAGERAAHEVVRALAAAGRVERTTGIEPA